MRWDEPVAVLLNSTRYDRMRCAVTMDELDLVEKEKQEQRLVT